MIDQSRFGVVGGVVETSLEFTRISEIRCGCPRVVKWRHIVINIEYIAEQYRLRLAAAKAWKPAGHDPATMVTSEAFSEPTSLDNRDKKRL
jgi:hypothetical protein